MVNATRPDRWKADTEASVAQYNSWFINAAPAAYRETRKKIMNEVHQAFKFTDYGAGLSGDKLKQQPEIISTLRMMTAPPIARDRLTGLARLPNNTLILRMEKGKFPARMASSILDERLNSIVETVDPMLDRDLMPWLKTGTTPTPNEVMTAEVVIADRLSGAMSNPIVRNAQEARQIAYIQDWLETRGYKHSSARNTSNFQPGEFGFHINIYVGTTKMPIDVVVAPKDGSGLLFIECKSAGDFTNTNKRRKEEAQKMNQIKAETPSQRLILFLCGYFDGGYLGYSAQEGLDWVWEHRIDDLIEFGL